LEFHVFWVFSLLQVGWHEHDPLEIWANVVRCMNAVTQALKKKQVKFEIVALGITNQRETTVAWNASTGKPYYNAIVWDDTRTDHIAATIAEGNANRLRGKTGLPLASYFAGTKVKWLLDSVPELQNDMKSKPLEVKFGTIDSWLLYQLSGKPSGTEGAANVGGLHLTDPSNASRWLFMDLEKVQWDKALVDTVCHPHQVPLSTLPEIRSSSEVYAICTKAGTGVDALEGVPVACILGDQQAALVGQAAFNAGEAKNTYGTGMFLMMNTGTKIVPSAHGLLTTVAYQLDNTVYYALEGSVSHAGSTIQWLRDQLQIISKASESEELAKKHDRNEGLYFVPAFSGLFAPHWRSDARACIVGMTATHDKGHICRAALEAACYQCKEVFDAIFEDSKVELTSLRVDGGGTHNELMMQFQADVINVPVIKPKIMETTSMGAAFGAGLAIGIWKDLDEVRALWSEARRFEPAMDDETRAKNWAGWTKAVSKSFGWITEEEGGEFFDATHGEMDLESTDKEKAPSRRGFGYRTIFFVAVAGTVAGFLAGTKGRLALKTLKAFYKK
jgi:glycerol kinase